MSHKISKIDRVFLAVIAELYEGKGWHGLGIPSQTIDVETCKEALFEHSYADAGIQLANGTFLPTGQRYAVHPDGKPIGNAVGARYHRPTNAQLFTLFSEALAGSEYELCSCGTLEEREQFFIDAKLKTNIEAGGRTIASFVGLYNAFGGKLGTVVDGHETVMQCANTTALFVSSLGEDTIGTKNTLNVMDRLPAIKKAIEKKHGVAMLFAKAMESAAKTKVDKDSAREAFTGLYGADGKKLVTRTVNRVNRLLNLFERGNGNNGENGADWFNAVTDYYSHENAGGGSLNNRSTPEEIQDFKQKQFFSSEFGAGRHFKEELTKRFMLKGEFNRAEFKKLRETGKELIASSDKELVAELN